MNEIQTKLAVMRALLARYNLGAILLRGVDWFAWATAGGSNVVLLTSETGVAELLITPDSVRVLTDSVEAERLRHEEVPHTFIVHPFPWNDPQAKATWLHDHITYPIASDRPQGAEVALPAELVAAKRRLLSFEVQRYRQAGAAAAAAVSEVMLAVRPTWTEQELAGAAAAALWKRGIQPALTLAGGAERLRRYGHTTPTDTLLGARAMLVVCGRAQGLYVNLTRFVHFRALNEEELQRFQIAREIEAVAWQASKPGTTLGAVYAEIVAAYTNQGYPGAEGRLHQGGTTGYLSREVIATPDDSTVIEANTALAWNPSLSGAKMEDTVLCTKDGIEILTVDPVWPTVEVAGKQRPVSLERS